MAARQWEQLIIFGGLSSDGQLQHIILINREEKIVRKTLECRFGNQCHPGTHTKFSEDIK